MSSNSLLIANMIALVVFASAGCESTTLVNDESTRYVDTPMNSDVEDVVVTAPARPVTFDQLKFQLKRDEEFRRDHLPDVVADIVGTRVRISGYMLPTFLKDNITSFALVKELSQQFAPTYAACEGIRVQMREEKSLSYSLQPFNIEGTFGIEPIRDGKKVVAVYKLVDALATNDRQQ